MAARVVLLNSCFVSARKDRIEHTAPQLRIGLAGIAAHLRERGAQVAVLDPQAHGWDAAATAAAAAEHNPTLVGLPAYTEEVQDAARIAQAVKAACPDALTVIGGYHVSALPARTLEEFPAFDVGLTGRAERTMAMVAEGVAPAEVPGAAYRDAAGRPVVNPPDPSPLALDALPYPAWDLYDLSRYEDRLPIEPLRGCPYPCVFCFRASGRAVDYKSPGRFLDELAFCRRTYGTRRFLFLAGTFPLDRRHAEAILRGLLERRLDVRWSASCRVDCVDDDLLALMRASGCKSLQLGIESGDPGILGASAKGITPERAMATVRACRRAGIRAGLNFILGLPGETEQTLEATGRLAARMMRYADNVNFAILVPFPGTPVYEMAARGEAGLGLRTTDWADFGKQGGLALRHAGFAEGDLQRWQSRLYLKCYLRRPLRALRYFSFGRAAAVLKRLLPAGRRRED